MADKAERVGLLFRFVEAGRMGPGITRSGIMDEHEKRALARRHVAAIKGFYIHLFVYILVIGILVVVDWSAGPRWWVHWPALGWGLGVLGHAFAVFGRSPAAFARWEDRKVDEAMRRIEAEESGRPAAREAPPSPRT